MVFDRLKNVPTTPGLKIPKLNKSELEAYEQFHKGGQANLEAALSHPDSLFLFQAYHASANPKLVAAKLDSMGSDANLAVADEDAKFMREAVAKATREHPWALFWYAVYRFVTSCIMLPGSLIWRTIDCTSVLANGIMVFSIITYAFTTFHMRGHIGRAFENNLLNKICTTYYDMMETAFLIPPQVWFRNHNLSHHVYTNLVADYDTTTPYPMYRVHPSQKWLWFHRFQAYYVIPILGFNSFLFPKFNLEVGKYSSYAAFIAYYFILICCPVLIFGASWASSLWSYFFLMYTIGIPTALLFQVSHNHPNNHHNNDARPASYREWLALQYNESMSWGGLLSCIVFGGINYQTEHHLWPAVHPILLHYMLEDSKELAKRVKARYTWEDNFFTATYQFLVHLNNLADPKLGVGYVKK